MKHGLWLAIFLSGFVLLALAALIFGVVVEFAAAVGAGP